MGVETPKDTNRASEAEIREVLAVEMATALYHTEQGALSRQEIEKLWRSEDVYPEFKSRKFRDHWRLLAAGLQTQLAEMGVRLRPSDSTKVKVRVEEIQTEPARKVFELPPAVADFDQSDDEDKG